MPDRLYDDAMYRFNEAEPSYWETTKGQQCPDVQKLRVNVECDVAIIGGGYTGLSAAYHLCKEHHVDVQVLEAGHIGWGSSARNAGFCCIYPAKMSVETMFKKFEEKLKIITLAYTQLKNTYREKIDR